MAAARISGVRQYLPVLTLCLGVGSILCTGVWYHYATKALADTKAIPQLLKMQMPKLFTGILPGFLIATLVVGILIPALALAARYWRCSMRGDESDSSSSPRALRPYLAVSGASNGLLYILVVWMAAALGVCMLWLGAGLVTAKSTLDASYTLADVDPAIQNLIKSATGGMIDPARDGFIVSAGNPKRDVDIGATSCGLFCFVLARAMMADSLDCTCDAAIMQQVSEKAAVVYHDQLMPALVCVLLGMLCTLGLLMAGTGQFSSAKAQAAGNAPIFSSSSSKEGLNGSLYTVPTDVAISLDQSSSDSITKPSPSASQV